MEGNLYIHIGPPRTATTAIQYAFQNGIPGKFFYGGVTQPRSKSVEISRMIHDLCITAGEVELNSISVVQKKIADILENGTNVVISEEMFLVDSGDINHQRKLARLSQVLMIFSPIIIICVRNPLDSLPSLYQEIFESLSFLEKISFDRFLHSNQAKIYDYIYLVDIVKRSGFDKINIVSFNDLVDGKLSYNNFFGNFFNYEKPLIISKKNSGRFIDSATNRELGQYFVRDIFPLKRILLMFPKKFRENPIIVKCLEKITELPFSGKRIRNLKFSDEIAKKFLSSYDSVLMRAEELNQSGDNLLQE